MSNFKHFETRAKAKAYIRDYPYVDGSGLKIFKKKGKHKKPFAVGTALSWLHFAAPSWV